jgi:hypothetical protein
LRWGLGSRAGVPRVGGDGPYRPAGGLQLSAGQSQQGLHAVVSGDLLAQAGGHGPPVGRHEQIRLDHVSKWRHRTTGRVSDARRAGADASFPRSAASAGRVAAIRLGGKHRTTPRHDGRVGQTYRLQLASRVRRRAHGGGRTQTRTRCTQRGHDRHRQKLLAAADAQHVTRQGKTWKQHGPYFAANPTSS